MKEGIRKGAEDIKNGDIFIFEDFGENYDKRLEK